MLHLIKRGPRQEAKCTSCGGNIAKGDLSYWSDKGGARYHVGCEASAAGEKIKGSVATTPEPKVDVEETTVTEEPTAESVDEVSEDSTEEEESEKPTLARLLRPRGQNGQFLPRT